MKAEEAAVEVEKPAEEAGAVSSEEEIKEEKPDPESTKTKGMSAMINAPAQKLNPIN